MMSDSRIHSRMSGMSGMAYAQHPHYQPDCKTIIKGPKDDIRTITVRIKSAVMNLKTLDTAQAINTMAQKCMKHGSVDVAKARW